MIPPYCERLRDRFDDYHDGELSPFLFQILRRHLEACPGCREEYQLFERVLEAVRHADAPEVSPGLLRKVVENLSGPGGGIPMNGRLFGPDLARGLEAP